MTYRMKIDTVFLFGFDGTSVCVGEIKHKIILTRSVNQIEYFYVFSRRVSPRWQRQRLWECNRPESKHQNL